MIIRKEYLNLLNSFKDKEVIKVITGIRRCGKSVLLKQFIDTIEESGVTKNKIIYMNLESTYYDSIQTYNDLYSYITSKIDNNSKHYIFIDEIQHVENFERAINSLQVDYNVDIYVTGSNAYLLSSEIATLLSGRYIEIKMTPLSFAEYVSGIENPNYEDLFYRYMKYGGFPFLARETDDVVINNYLDGIYSTVVLNDVIKRNTFKDISLLENVLKTVLSSIGSYVSSNSITKTLKASRSQISYETVDSILQALCNAYILYKTDRYDLKGKAYLKTLQKYYVPDMGLRNNILGYRQIEPTHALENIVYFELLRRGYKVDVGKVDDTEIDFVARKQDKTEYYQVSYSVAGTDTMAREIRPFKLIDDYNSRIIITMDRDFVSDIDGIRKVYAVDWLLQKGFGDMPR